MSASDLSNEKFAARMRLKRAGIEWVEPEVLDAITEGLSALCKRASAFTTYQLSPEDAFRDAYTEVNDWAEQLRAENEDIETAQGLGLEHMASYVGVARTPGETDVDLRERLRVYVEDIRPVGVPVNAVLRELRVSATLAAAERLKERLRGPWPAGDPGGPLATSVAAEKARRADRWLDRLRDAQIDDRLFPSTPESFGGSDFPDLSSHIPNSWDYHPKVKW